MNTIEFKVYGNYALFTDPISRIGGEKCSYLTPTYEALKGITKSIYWKPSLIWYVDKVRVMKKIRTQTRGIKTLKISGGNDLSIYSYLFQVEYQVQAHFEFNAFHKNLVPDHNVRKHMEIALRSVERGGRRDIFLGTRDCQAYVEPCSFGEGAGDYDGEEISFGIMFHGFDYPDETATNKLVARLWQQKMVNGIITYDAPTNCKIRRFVRDMTAKTFSTEVA